MQARRFDSYNSTHGGDNFTLIVRFNVGYDEFTLDSPFRVLVREEGSVHVSRSVGPSNSGVGYSKRYTLECDRGAWAGFSTIK